MDPLVLGLVMTGVIAVGVGGYFLGRRASPDNGGARGDSGRRLEEYDFYPFVVGHEGHVEFSAERFDQAVIHLLEERNEVAAGELIVIGEQNLVRDTFGSEQLRNYKHLYATYDGDGVVSDNDAYLENYRRLVNQFGRSFPNTGIEILLHNLVNPSRSLVAIENGAVTGRSVGSGATNLVLDLKTRRQRGEDKVNYELNIGSRQFKCTTVPIFRPEYGLVGAVCINIDTHFIREAASAHDDRLDAFVDNVLRTDFELNENILSKDEYRSAMRGKRHYLDEAIRSRGTRAQERRLAAVFFSDIVGFTALMGSDEAATLKIMKENEEIHLRAFTAHGGRLLKRLGDGILASFDSASGAVAAAKDIQRAAAEFEQFELRIGIHLGEILQDDDDIHGDGVNIASRIQTEVDAGEIGISKVVYDNIKNKDGLTASLLGERSLKNVERPIALYLVDV